MNRLKKFTYTIPAGLWMVIIFAFSHQPDDLSSKNNHFIAELLRKIHISLFENMDYELLNLLIRKAAHITEFLILFFLVYYAVKNICQNNWELTSSIITLLYACSDEFHQLFIKGRAGRVQDVLIDSMGIIIGLIILKIIKIIKDKKKSSHMRKMGIQ
ncbi:VanZ like family protein [Hathewaya proteolytica DSM 3090]|uniref:VanZ like family protein n=1 Tax=Hathewaya proteolytica DSM 3090 TaxID=1121331 RepID=A0A1M6JQ75_9CLOT|nr:VanZ family protein [Hathewaya proteolytica]SHJ48857.1 VanZ like family protein [Hathewaya proteolytica DSM 3090]